MENKGKFKGKFKGKLKSGIVIFFLKKRVFLNKFLIFFEVMGCGEYLLRSKESVVILLNRLFYK